jgi:hypothetical protein
VKKADGPVWDHLLNRGRLDGAKPTEGRKIKAWTRFEGAKKASQTGLGSRAGCGAQGPRKSRNKSSRQKNLPSWESGGLGSAALSGGIQKGQKTMKKIMLSAAVLAALIGTATAATTVTSANTVGYQEISLTAGYHMITPTFLDTGATEAKTYNIQDIIPTGVGDGGAMINMINEQGNFTAVYVWYTGEYAGNEDEQGNPIDGWCDNNYELVDVTLKQGQSFIVYMKTAGNVTVKGAVATGGVTRDISGGYIGFGNASPIAINIQTISPSGVDDGGAMINMINEQGNFTAVYVWYTGEYAGNEDEQGNPIDGWCDNNYELVDVAIQPGRGFVLYTKTAATLTAPTAIK